MPEFITRRNPVPRWRGIAKLDACFDRREGLEKFDEGNNQAALGDQCAE